MECISSLWAKIAKWFRDHFESALPFFKQRAVTSEGAEHDASAFDATAISKEAARKYEAMVAEGEVKTMDPTDVRYGKFLALVGKHFAGHDELAKVKSLVEKHGNENKAALEILKTKKNLRTALFLSWALKKQPATDMAHRIVLNLDPDDRLHILEQAQELEKEYTIHLITLEILYRKIHRV
uniref:Uncharacterized protein n=1 Tax=Peronospora matthiolae TaxID=2874970 RepID=A0AAV1TDJ3_9STRA